MPSFRYKPEKAKSTIGDVDIDVVDKLGCASGHQHPIIGVYMAPGLVAMRRLLSVAPL
jgi:hypothetical protein